MLEVVADKTFSWFLKKNVDWKKLLSKVNFQSKKLEKEFAFF